MADKGSIYALQVTTRFIMINTFLINNSFLNVLLYNVISMVTVTRGEIIELNVRIETARIVRISFFACFCISSNSRITVFNHYSRQFDP